jgi:hypothetical protein
MVIGFFFPVSSAADDILCIKTQVGLTDNVLLDASEREARLGNSVGS